MRNAVLMILSIALTNVTAHATDSLLGLSVATYLDKPEDKVTLEVRQGALQDGTTYTAQTTLDAVAKNIRVVIQNSGYRPVTQ